MKNNVKLTAFPMGLGTVPALAFGVGGSPNVATSIAPPFDATRSGASE